VAAVVLITGVGGVINCCAILNEALAVIKSEEEKAIIEYNRQSKINKTFFIVGAGVILFISAILIKRTK
jgi:hypothetical protein